MITFGRKLYCANVGDSRTILVKASSNSKDGCRAFALSRDHKPSDAGERNRIEMSHGRIESYKDYYGKAIGPMRVWLKHEDIPGLAMTRSFGDQVAARVGVNAIPEIKEYTLGVDDKIIVLASDGVWEFLSNEQVASTAFSYLQSKNAEAAAENLVRMAYKAWKREESVVDDITCIVVFLDVK